MHFQPNNYRVNLDGLDMANARLNLTISVRHQTNWQDWEEHWARRSRLLEFIREAIEQEQIACHGPIQQVKLVSQGAMDWYSNKSEI